VLIVFNGADHHKAIISTWNVIDDIATKIPEMSGIVVEENAVGPGLKDARGHLCMACIASVAALFPSG